MLPYKKVCEDKYKTPQKVTQETNQQSEPQVPPAPNFKTNVQGQTSQGQTAPEQKKPSAFKNLNNVWNTP